MIEHLSDGTTILTDDADPARTVTIAAGTPQAELEAQIVAFFPTVLPDEVDMYRVRAFLAQKGVVDGVDYLGRITAWIGTLPQPQQAMAEQEFEYAPRLIVAGALAKGAQAALGFSDADYATMILTAAGMTL